MKTAVIAITSTCVDNVALLPPRFTSSCGQYTCLIHHTPHAKMVNNAPVCNFDLHIDFDTRVNHHAAGLYPDHYVPMTRNSKTLQTFEMERVIRKHGLPLSLPSVFASNYQPSIGVALAMVGLPQSDRVVVKRENGARGCNHAVVPTAQLNDFMARGELPFKELKATFPDVVFSPMYSTDGVQTEEMETKPYFQGDSVMVCEYIPNIIREYRLLVGGEQIWVRERELKGGTYRQANMDITATISGDSTTYTPLSDHFDTDLRTAIQTLVREIGLTYGSIDLFERDDGRFGIFEYCHQFGFKNTCPHFIADLTKAFVEHEVRSRLGMAPGK